LKAIQAHGTGEMLMEQIIFHGIRINIYLFIVVHAGLKEQHQLLQIGSILNIGKI
jgi:hypothetical protein